MNWTTEKPVQAGWYWIRPFEDPTAEPKLVKIYDDASVRYVSWGDDRVEEIKEVTGEWAGPITDPGFTGYAVRATSEHNAQRKWTPRVEIVTYHSCGTYRQRFSSPEGCDTVEEADAKAFLLAQSWINTQLRRNPS